VTLARLRPAAAVGSVTAPPSKSYTHRALVAGALTLRRYRILRPLDADDTRRTAAGLEQLGSAVTRHRGRWELAPRRRPPPRGPVDCGESGSTLRFLAPVAALRTAGAEFVGRGRLPERPMGPLLRALEGLGAEVSFRGARGLPLRIRGPIRGGRVRLDASESSQFASALLLSLPTITPDSTLVLEGPVVSEGYLESTLAVLAYHRVRVDRSGRTFRIAGGQRYRGSSFRVPGDASSAAYLWAAAAVTRGRVEVRDVPARWPQADLDVLDLFRSAGARVTRTGDRVRVEGRTLEPFDVELTRSPDLYPLAGVLASCARGTSHLTGAPQVVLKESDRRAGTVRLARALGARVVPTEKGLRIRGSERPRPLRMLGETDHRMVMSAAVGALASDRPSEIGNADAVRKSFPGFWTSLAQLGPGVTVR
jgi:3-phosphoshikimate 1-carboxyvinyltransferase